MNEYKTHLLYGWPSLALRMICENGDSFWLFPTKEFATKFAEHRKLEGEITELESPEIVFVRAYTHGGMRMGQAYPGVEDQTPMKWAVKDNDFGK